MPKKILLIENDSAFAAEVSEALERSGFDVRATGDGKDGLDLAREWAPEAVVLCVELPGMSGYLTCQKLKRDDALKGIPLVLTSAEATQETFDKHRTLKARADEYLLKPYLPGDLLEKLAALVGLPERARAEGGEEELVSLEEEMGLEGLSTEPVADLPPFDLESLSDEPSSAATSTDEDLRLLDDAFDGLSAPSEPEPARSALDLELDLEGPLPGDDLDVDDALLPDEDEGTARADLGDLDVEDALGALGADDEPLGSGLELDMAPAARPPLRGANPDLLRAAGITLLDDDAPAAAAVLPPHPPPPARDREDVVAASAATVERLERQLVEAQQSLAETRGLSSGRESELRQLRQRLDDAARYAEEAESVASEKDVELASTRARLDAITAQARKGDADLRAVREEVRRTFDQAKAAEGEIDELRRRVADAERRAEGAEARVEDAEAEARRKGDELALATEAAGKTDALERELEGLRTELMMARGEVDGARGEIEERTAGMGKRLVELEAANAKNEERVLKAYQKIKNDEKVKDKVRKAIAIAGQLLEDGLPAEAPAEKSRPSPVTLLGRE